MTRVRLQSARQQLMLFYRQFAEILLLDIYTVDRVEMTQVDG